MTNVSVKATGAELSVQVEGLLTSGMVGVPVSFAFDEAWDGLIKTAVFRAGWVSKDRADIEGETTVPWEVLQQQNYKLQIGVYGASADGTLVIPTIWAEVGPIYPGADPAEDESTDPTLPVWQKALTTAEHALDVAQQLQDRADRGEFNGAPGPDEVFIAEYGVTQYEELDKAYNAGRVLFCRDGNYIIPFYERTNAGSYTFYSHDSTYQTNRYCTKSGGWNRNNRELCADAFAGIENTIGDIGTALDSIIAIQNSLIGGDGA